jgi:crotonobetainyl-CoA:carnitine CoA-transferase CaiB-like acyl-CoA transferase
MHYSPDKRTALDGLRVLDLSRFIAGPLCCQILGDMGAEVIKVERPGGEDARRHEPFYKGNSIYTMVFNRNKLGVTLNTRHIGATRILEALVASSDVVVENYRPGTLEKMGFSFERMHEINPRVILVSISGFGQHGRNSKRALFDAVAQAESGLMSVTGSPQGEPMMVGTFIADYVAAFHGAMGAMTALLARTITGLGQHVDIACVDALFSTMGTYASAYAMLGKVPGRNGNRDQITVPANVFKTRDDRIYIHAGTNPLFRRLATVMGRPDLVDDERFSDQERRLANIDLIESMVQGWTSSLSREEVAAALSTAGVPFAKVASLAEAVESEQIEDREMLINIDHPLAGRITVPGIPIKLSDTPGNIRKAPPLPGEDNDKVYGEILGMTSDEVADMCKSGLI